MYFRLLEHRMKGRDNNQSRMVLYEVNASYSVEESAAECGKALRGTQGDLRYPIIVRRPYRMGAAGR
jgi:hypothetical protein